jgi:hypothetical protein
MSVPFQIVSAAGGGKVRGVMSAPDPAPTPTPDEVDAALGFWMRRRLALAWTWQKVRDVGAILRPCRFSVFVVAAGGALLLATAQGRELAVGLPDGGFLGGLAFHACVLFWAFQSWYWSRLLLDVMFGLDRERDAGGAAYPAHAVWWLRETPRIVAIAAYVVAGVALALAQAWWHLAALIAVGALFYAFLVRPLALTDALHRMFGAAARPIIGAPGQRVYRLRDLPQFSQAVLRASLVLAVLFTAWVIADPVAFGWAFGAAAVPFIGFALIVPVGSLLVYWSHWSGAPAGLLDRRGYPVVTFLVLWAAIVGAVFEHHAVRTTASAPGAGPAARETLPDAALRWHAQAAKAARSDAPPLVIVATAGGGLRAAYWTATVLGRLQDEAPDFRSYLFGISGVSGGSLGAAVFVTLLADGAPAPTPACGSGGKAFECAGQAVLAQDFLAPTAASMLFPDLMQRFVPAPVFPEDRAAALERGWERAWGQAGLAKDAWTRRSFPGLWRGPAGHLPSLFLNGTHVETGKRIITASVKIDGAAFRDAYDFFALVSGDVLPSTAVHNSARFPYVSPAGTLRADGANRGHIVDGGYFENFGATTAAELLHAAIEQLGRRGNTARPVLIQITNDPQLRDDELEVDRLEDPAPRPGNRLGNEILSPPRTLLNTRNARGILAYKAFLRAAPPDRRAHFRLCDVKDLPEPALGWVLAKSSLALMQRIARDDTCGNRTEFERVVKALRH